VHAWRGMIFQGTVGMRKFDTINVIPFVDIMLVLLAIVLTTATFVRNGDLPITLPSATAKPATENSQSIEIVIDVDGNYYLEGTQVLAETLDEKLYGTDSQTLIKLKIEESVVFSEFVSIIDVLKSLSLENLSIATRNAQ